MGAIFLMIPNTSCECSSYSLACYSTNSYICRIFPLATTTSWALVPEKLPMMAFVMLVASDSVKL